MYSKQEMRTVIKGYRKTLSRDDAVLKSIAILDKLFKTQYYEKAGCIYCYVDFQNEVMTMPLIKKAFKDGKRVAVPKIENGSMEFYYIKGYEDLKEGTFGILEPVGCEMASETDALLIMPGVAFDKDNHRIGYGGGYYDRYLKRENSHFKIALAFDFQIFEAVTYEEHDICPDLVLTETERGL